MELGEIASKEAATAHKELDLIIWGGCHDEETLVVTMELLGIHGPSDIVELSSTQVSTLDLERTASLGRAIMAYLLDQHSAAAESFAALAQSSTSPTEQADLTFLQATSLLFEGRYEEAALAYEAVWSDERLGSRARLNAGVAAINRSIQIRIDQPDDDEAIEEAIQVAVNRLEAAVATSEVRADQSPGLDQPRRHRISVGRRRRKGHRPVH